MGWQVTKAAPSALLASIRNSLRQTSEDAILQETENEHHSKRSSPNRFHCAAPPRQSDRRRARDCAEDSGRGQGGVAELWPPLRQQREADRHVPTVATIHQFSAMRNRFFQPCRMNRARAFKIFVHNMASFVKFNSTEFLNSIILFYENVRTY